jgi:hypothetical protein
MYVTAHVLAFRSTFNLTAMKASCVTATIALVSS